MGPATATSCLMPGSPPGRFQVECLARLRAARRVRSAAVGNAGIAVGSSVVIMSITMSTSLVNMSSAAIHVVISGVISLIAIISRVILRLRLCRRSLRCWMLQSWVCDALEPLGAVSGGPCAPFAGVKAEAESNT